MIKYECKGCGTIIYLEEEGEPSCPMCRMTMTELGVCKRPAGIKKFICPECGHIFYMKKGDYPYKCPFCDYTFPPTPKLQQEEKL